MSERLTKQQFIEANMGREWVRGEFACFDLVRDSFEQIDGINLTHADDEAAASYVFEQHYKPCERKEGAVFNCYDSNGAWTHIGRILMGKAFHNVRDGCVCFWEIETLERFYQMQGGRVEYVMPNGAE